MDARGYMITEERWVEKEVEKDAPPTPPSRKERAPAPPKHSVAAACAQADAADDDDDDDDAPALGGKKGKAKGGKAAGGAKPKGITKSKPKDTGKQGSIMGFFGK